jgi:DNA-3-methyladenine glycosylase
VERLKQRFFARDVVVVARELLGQVLVHAAPEGTTSGRIVETEAYLAAEDPACHAFRGRTARNASMFGPAGRAYVYAIHSRWCLNAVAEGIDVPAAVLIRAVEPLEGIELMQARRGRTALLDLARGPGRLCQAFGIDRQLDGWDLTNGETLWIGKESKKRPRADEIAISPRIGVTSAHDLPLRFFIKGSRFVSGRRNGLTTRGQ